MTTEQLLQYTPEQISTMGVGELRQVVSALSSTANKRLKRLEKSGNADISPAYESARKRAYTGRFGGKFGTQGKNLNELRNEYKAVKSFLGTKTGSIRSMQKSRKEMFKRIGGKFSSKEQEKAFYRAFRKTLENDKAQAGISGYGSEVTQQDIYRTFVKRGYNEIADEINTHKINNMSESSLQDAIENAGVEFSDNINVNKMKYFEYLKKNNLYLSGDNNTETSSKVTGDEAETLALMGEMLNVKYEKEQDYLHRGEL